MYQYLRLLLHEDLTRPTSQSRLLSRSSLDPCRRAPILWAAARPSRRGSDVPNVDVPNVSPGTVNNGGMAVSLTGEGTVRYLADLYCQKIAVAYL